MKKGINQSGDVLGYRLNGGGPEVSEVTLVSSIDSYRDHQSVGVFAPKRQRDIRVTLNGVRIPSYDAESYLDQNNTYPDKIYVDNLVERSGMSQGELAWERIKVGFSEHTLQ